MNSNRLWIIGTVVIVIGVVALAWVLGVSPKLAEARQSNLTADQVDADNAVLQQQIIALKAAYENIDDVRAELEEIEKSVPPTAGIPDFIRQLNTMAGVYGVEISSIATGVGATYQPTGESASPEVQNATGIVGTDSLVLIPMTIRIAGSYDAILNFNEGLQTGTRLFMSTGMTAQSSGNAGPPPEKGAEPAPPLFTGEVSGFIFVVLNPNAPAEVPDAGTDTPTSTPTPTPTPTEVPTPDPSATAAAFRR